MRCTLAIPALALFAACAPSGAFAQAAAPAPAAARPATPAMHPVVMGMTSPSFEDGAVLPDRHTIKGGPTAPSPSLTWTGAPAGTQSFTLIMHDLDVVVGKTTGDNLHWLAFDIPATTTTLPEGVPIGPKREDGMVQVMNRGAYGYNPPGAPPGVYHHYVFEVFALDSKLGLGPDSTRADVLKAMDGHVLDKATLVSRFHR